MKEKTLYQIYIEKHYRWVWLFSLTCELPEGTVESAFVAKKIAYYNWRRGF